VNVHSDSDEDDLEILRISKEVEVAQGQRLAEYRAQRDGRRADEALDRLRAACRTDENLVPVIMDAVRADATLGEICGAMKDVFGTYREPPA
jgi:methylmalonyl-CoA mutase, N-terminal domain